MWHWGDHMGWGWMGIWWLILLLILAAMIWFAVNAARRTAGGPREDSAEEALKRRYARGEIDRETFRRMLEELRK